MTDKITATATPALQTNAFIDVAKTWLTLEEACAGLQPILSVLSHFYGAKMEHQTGHDGLDPLRSNAFYIYFFCFLF